MHHAHFQEVSLTQIPVNHVKVNILRKLIQPLDESQGSSQLHGQR